MSRIYVTEQDTDHELYDPQPRRRAAGYFNEDRATYWHGNKRVFDGANLADVNTRDQNRGEGLYRTAQGRWVLRTWSRWQGETDTHTYVDEADAREWLLFNDYEDEVRQYFSEPEEERGPGRPEVGGTVSLRLGDVLGPLDTYAADRGLSRADAARRLLGEALRAEQPYAVQWRDASGFEWETLDTYTRPGDALTARDKELSEEPEWLPRGRHRAVDMHTGEILEWRGEH